ncbi:MAG: energy-coupling factor transporter transmembrane component T [Methanomicrobiales archaeon]|jgi:cobalt/nickel transport system permease protein
MSALPVSSHIPDPDLITYYAEKQDSFFSGVSPWTKLFSLAVLIIGITLLRNPLVLLVLYLTVLSLFILAKLPVKKLFRWYLFPLLFVISLVGILAWTQPGNPVLGFSVAGIPVILTDMGILLVVTLSLKTLISVTYSLFFLMTTRYEYLSGMISRIFPAPIDQIFLMAYRFFFLTFAMVGSILKAVRSRGGSLVRGMRTEGTLFAEIIGLVFIRSFDRAERVEKAMRARGYRGSYSNTTEIPAPGIGGYGVLALCILVMAAGSLVLSSGGW